MGTYRYVAVCGRGRLGDARRFGAHRGRRGAGHIVATARLQLVLVLVLLLLLLLLLASHCQRPSSVSLSVVMAVFPLVPCPELFPATYVTYVSRRYCRIRQIRTLQ